jgi:hypothetical protein
MANISLLQNGCSGQDIIDTVNAIIASLNSGGGLSISYNDLTDKPTINGVEIAGALTTTLLRIAMSDTEGYAALLQTLATKAYADAVKTEALSAAQTAVNAALDSKMDKDLGNIEIASSVGDDAYIAVVSGGKIVKITTKSLATYTELVSRRDSSTYEAAAKTQRKTIELEEAPDGQTITFTATTAFQLKSSALYLNGNRLLLDTDYKEDSSTQVTFKTIIPEDGDILFFEAIPLE